MEETKPLFSGAELKRLILPIILEQLLAVTIGVADTIMVLVAGEAAVSAISLVDALNILMNQFFAALCTGGAIVISQYMGANDMHSARQASRQLIYSVLTLMLVITLLAQIFAKPILHILFGKVEPEVMENAFTYFRITSLSYPFFAFFSAGSVLYRCIGRSKVSLYVSILINLVNIGGNAILINCFNWGVAGAGTATLSSWITGAIIMLYLVQKESCPLHIKQFWRISFNWKYISNILKIGVPNGMETLLFYLGKLIVQGLVATFETSAITANAIVNSVAGFIYAPGLSLGLGLVTVVGCCMGAREIAQAEKYTKRIVGTTILVLAVLNVLLFAGSDFLTSLFHLSPQAAETSARLLRWFAVGDGLLWALGFTTPNALRAAGDVKFTMITALLSMGICRIGLSYVFGLFLNMGLYGVWLAMFVDWVVRAILFTVRFYRGRWKNFQVI